MRKFLLVVAVVFLGFHLSLAAESTLSASYTDNSLAAIKAKTGEFTTETAFKVSERNLFGPAFQAEYVGGKRTGTGAGLFYEFGPTTGLIRPFAGAQVLYWFGQYNGTVDYQGSARVGLKFGGALFIKGFVERVRQHSPGGPSADATGVQVAFGVKYGK